MKSYDNKTSFHNVKRGTDYNYMIPSVFCNHFEFFYGLEAASVRLSLLALQFFFIQDIILADLVPVR